MSFRASLPALVFALVLLAGPVFAADAPQVIGSDTLFNFVPSVFLVANVPEEVAGVKVFNYFFSLELFVGLFAVFFRSILRVIPGF